MSFFGINHGKKKIKSMKRYYINDPAKKKKHEKREKNPSQSLWI
jgi:fructose-1,6-bisphosphatase